MSFVGAALLLAAGALGDLLGPWALVIALPLVAVAVWLLAHSLPLVLMSARLRPLQLGPTVIRSARRLSEDEEWELFRLVDLVKGRLWATAPGAECGGCEVWVLAHRRDAERLSRARCIGVGIVGPAVCAVPAAHLRDGEAVLRAIAAGVAHDDISDLFAAYTGIQGEELLLLDIDHKAILVFSIDGQYVGKSELPKELKLRANNHYTGLGYANQLFFVFHEPEGEFGTYYAFKVQK